MTRLSGPSGWAASVKATRSAAITLPPTIFYIVPIDKIDLVGQIAVAECLGKSGGSIERQWPE
jgi:hypothetical protein